MAPIPRQSSTALTLQFRNQSIELLYIFMYNIKKGPFVRDSTTVAKFREKLASWLDIAKDQTVYINRGEERFALMSEEAFRNLNQKVNDLQSSLIVALDPNEIVETSSIDDVLSTLKKYKRKKA
jgi:hypothetical protein